MARYDVDVSIISIFLKKIINQFEFEISWLVPEAWQTNDLFCFHLMAELWLYQKHTRPRQRRVPESKIQILGDSVN